MVWQKTMLFPKKNLVPFPKKFYIFQDIQRYQMRICEILGPGEQFFFSGGAIADFDHGCALIQETAPGFKAWSSGSNSPYAGVRLSSALLFLTAWHLLARYCTI